MHCFQYITISFRYKTFVSNIPVFFQTHFHVSNIQFPIPISNPCVRMRIIIIGRLYGRAKRRPINLTIKQSAELNSVGPETPKSMKFFWFGPLPAMTSSSLIRLQRPLPLSGDVISKNENRTL